MYAQKISSYERRWAFFHPVAAIKVKRISKKCNAIYQDDKIRRELDYFVYGGKLDAFRHVFFMAACARKVKIRKLRKLGQKHEMTNYRMFLKAKQEFGESADSLGSVMDLHNNEVGFRIGCEKRKASLDELKSQTIGAIKAGEALILKRKKNGDYLGCDDRVIDLSKYKGIWAVPKCLVRSDYVYPD